MKSVKLNDGKVEARRITIKRRFFEDHIYIVCVGRRVLFTEETDQDCTNVDYANLVLGVKTAARLFQSALDGKTVKRSGVNSAYASYGTGNLVLERNGSKIQFEAPCGATGYITVGEAMKIVEHLSA